MHVKKYYILSKKELKETVVFPTCMCEYHVSRLNFQVMFNNLAGRVLSGYKATRLRLVGLYPDKTLIKPRGFIP